MNDSLYVTTRGQWRSWLTKNGNKAQSVWLIYYKKQSGKPRISYEDAVEEALCFGWIDGKIKKLDDERYAQIFSPRNPKGRWSRLNISRAEKLIKEGKMTALGLAVFRPERKSEPLPQILPKELETRFKAHSSAWENFQTFPPYYRRLMIGWVACAKKEETQIKRLERLITASAANQRVKLM